jgi:RNA polymerase sigma factor (sigma-70 family)
MTEHAPHRVAPIAAGGPPLPEPDNDAALLERFVADRDEAAFAELVRRHGPMVRATCRRFLGNTPDADDAFQAVFVVLARKAGEVRRRRLLGPWLHTVAVRAAGRARNAARRRAAFERPVTAMPEPELLPADPPPEWLPLLHEELERLPEKYRDPLVLCELQGRSRAEAAEALGIPEGTLSSRLARGRALLRRRLVRRGVAAAALAALLAVPSRTEAVPPKLVETTTKAATGAASASVNALTHGVLRTMLFAKLKTWAIASLVTLGLLGAAVPLVLLAAEEKKADKELLQGTWDVVTTEKNFPNARIPDIKQLVFDGEQMRADDHVMGKFNLDPKQNPKHFDIIPDSGPKSVKGMLFQGIYELKGDELKICTRAPGKERPTEFTGKEGSECMLIVLKRAK